MLNERRAIPAYRDRPLLIISYWSNRSPSPAMGQHAASARA
ncbi:hypothetical protein LCGC14_0467760 [marine sediment metagenome]|uniref:Uncharacterized protein n=1 Tax=marine sediment metagenome TaxID=412755 RepID=A0A0F9V000_9ZZZZ